MNKLLKIIFMMLLIGILTACGNNNNDEAKDNGTDNATENTDTANEGANGTDAGTTNDDATNSGTSDEGATNNTEAQNVEVADEVADVITELEEVESASVLVTDNNAYVAVELSEGTEETEEIKTKISDAAKAENADFNNVYVSANPDFSQQFRDYGDRIRADEPVEGFFDEFTDTVERVFPDQAK
ncbi:YhcN/YlaJ family sporulation lipoprotein [Psychrobacillus psychrodurans]|uniref:YhcN/YlaJ family sporulation lipoprotein n=1 Tax=Psychrobacillus psychrodurans TaxID=126157 RepID=A0A9X3L9W7_9BACI|nr:YhcN/YlaJ family sporulation lipoprotein [Psychrobacillus psychrodurans]MCZ8533830.1 YhcN/YlaJ family sporulation lipoprotein [Psychrobacillus psychrodurans]